MKKNKVAAITAAALLVITAGGGYALGANTPFTLNSDGPFYACVTGVNGNITKVTNTPKTCPKGTLPINWNNIGPKGDKGDKGDSGTSSAAGTFIQSPDGSASYPVFAGIGADTNALRLVKIGENVFVYKGPNVGIGGETYVNTYARGYQSLNCTGSEKMISDNWGWPSAESDDTPQLVGEFYFGSFEPNGDETLIGQTSLNRNIQFNDLGSYMDYYGCHVMSTTVAATKQRLISSIEFVSTEPFPQSEDGLDKTFIFYLGSFGLKGEIQYAYADNDNLCGSTYACINSFEITANSWDDLKSKALLEVDNYYRNGPAVYDFTPVQVPDLSGWTYVIK